MTINADRLVSDVMTPVLVSVPPDASVYRAAEAMRENDIGDVLVMEDSQVHGVVTDRDLAVRVLANQLDPANTTVADVCSREVVSVPPTAQVGVAIGLMRDQAVRRLPVISDDGRAHGIVTIGDLAVTQAPQSALADISAAPPNV